MLWQCKRHAREVTSQCYYNTEERSIRRYWDHRVSFRAQRNDQPPTARHSCNCRLTSALFGETLVSTSAERGLLLHQTHALRTFVESGRSLHYHFHECATWLLALHCASNASCWLTPATSCVPHKPVSAVATPSRVLLTQCVTHAECLLAVPRHKTCMLQV
jgi:hypothetical protein